MDVNEQEMVQQPQAEALSTEQPLAESDQQTYEQQMAEYERQMKEYEQQQQEYEQQQTGDMGEFPPLTQEYQQPATPKPRTRLPRTGAKPVLSPLVNNPDGTTTPKRRTRRSAGVRFTPPSGALPVVRSAADITEGTEDGVATAENPTTGSRRRVTKSRIALFIDIDGTNISRDNLEELFYSITARQEILFAKIYGYGEDKVEFDDIIQKYNIQTAGRLDSKASYGNRIDPRVLLDAYECASKNKTILDTVFVWCAPCELSYMFERIIKLGVATSTIDNPYFDCNNQWTSNKIKLFSPYSPFYDPNYAYGYDQAQYQQQYDYSAAQQQYYEQPAQQAYVPEPAPVAQPAPTPAPVQEAQPAYSAPAPAPAPVQQLTPDQMTPEQIAEQMPWLIPETPPDQPQMQQQYQQPQQQDDDFEPEPEGVTMNITESYNSEADMDKPPETEEDNRMMVIDMMKEMGMDFNQQVSDSDQMAGMMGEDTSGGGNLDDI